MITRLRLGLVISALVLAWVGISLAGSSSHSAPAFHTRLLLLDAVSTGQRLIAVGERGFILLSDNGQHWRAAQTVGSSTLTALTQRGSLLWAVGHDATILKSTDSGASWRRVHYAPDAQRPLLDITFIDDTRGFAVGAYGFFLETRDAGEHWTARNIAASDLHYNAIAMLGNGTLLIAGESGTLLRSTDAGHSWHGLTSPYAGSWFGVVALNDQTALILGLRGKLYRTEDAGGKWIGLPDYTVAALMGGRVLENGTVMVAGNDGVILTSTDAGRTFKSYRQAGNPALATLLGSKNYWWLFGERGAMRVPAPQ